jgi:hypothetical protein
MSSWLGDGDARAKMDESLRNTGLLVALNTFIIDQIHSLNEESIIKFKDLCNGWNYAATHRLIEMKQGQLKRTYVEEGKDLVNDKIPPPPTTTTTTTTTTTPDEINVTFISLNAKAVRAEVTLKEHDRDIVHIWHEINELQSKLNDMEGQMKANKNQGDCNRHDGHVSGCNCDGGVEEHLKPLPKNTYKC